ncbi:MAG: RNA-binding protein [Planctomycetes bacterium]|nr:RNA-binding protein [Planctomycetota bacterium]
MRIYVGNLPFSTGEAELQELFSAHGEVTSAAIITDRETGRPRGFGFVEMSDDAAARTAIEQINGSTVDGRTLKVNEAKPREQRTGGGGGGGGYGGGGGRRGGGW